MGKPSFGLQKPAVTKVAFVSENSRVPINPVIIVGSERKVLVIYKLLIGDPSRITTVKPTGVEIECQQLMLVRPIAQVEISLPQIVLAVITLPACSLVPGIKAKFQRTHSLLNHNDNSVVSERFPRTQLNARSFAFEAGDSGFPEPGGRRDSNPQQPEPQSGALPLSYDHHNLKETDLKIPIALCKQRTRHFPRPILIISAIGPEPPPPQPVGYDAASSHQAKRGSRA